MRRETKYPVLPPGWEESIDPDSGKKYYANRSTQETRWDPPPAPPKMSPVMAQAPSTANLKSSATTFTDQFASTISGRCAAHERQHSLSKSR